ncbi:hypothetical protein CEQ90_10855 [Lewinellaceae bacterium SD302]|nr:hypothetical protein CEQ90_10855 [Lewinellaceae bacterium SD302]
MNKKSNKLISLMITFDRDMVKRCNQFLSSPYFNRSQDLQHYFAEVSRRLSKGLSLDKEMIWKSVWKKKPFNDVRFRKFSSDLLKLLEKFVVQEELESNKIIQQDLWLAAVNRLQPTKQKEAVLRNWSGLIETTEEVLAESSRKYLSLFQFERKRYELSNFDNRTEERSNLETIMHNLDVFYISEKLHVFNSAKSTYFARYHQYEFAFIESLVDNIRENPVYLKYPTISMHYYTYLIGKEPENESHYRAFKSLLLNQSSDLKESDLQTHYYTALNYSTIKINSGNTDYLKEYIEVYKDGLVKEALFENGHITAQQFKNIISIALRNGDFEWVKSYIDNYQDRIPEQHRENAVNLNLAFYHFYKKDYDKAMDYLRGVEYENITYNLNAKSMLLAIYYETDEFDALDSLFDAILAYLSRHKEIPANYKKLFRNLVSVTRKMTRIIPGDKKAIEKLRKEVEETKAIASLNWVREKLDELA